MWVLLCVVFLAAADASKYARPPQGRIMGGKVVQINEYPHQALLIHYPNMLYCGGSIISADAILTTASCVPTINIAVYVGISTYKEVLHTSPIPVETIVKHPFYSATEEFARPARYNVALVRLKVSLTFTENIRSIPLSFSTFPGGTNAIIVGWGRSENSNRPSYLRAATVTMILPCPLGILCSNDVLATACYGDAGGPLIVNKTLVGITVATAGPHCTGKGYFVNIMSVIRFIVNTMNDNL